MMHGLWVITVYDAWFVVITVWVRTVYGAWCVGNNCVGTKCV